MVLSSTSKSHGAVVDMAIVLLDAHDEHDQGDEDLIDNSIDICQNITRRRRPASTCPGSLAKPWTLGAGKLVGQST